MECKTAASLTPQRLRNTKSKGGQDLPVLSGVLCENAVFPEKIAWLIVFLSRNFLGESSILFYFTPSKKAWARRVQKYIRDYVMAAL